MPILMIADIADMENGADYIYPASEGLTHRPLVFLKNQPLWQSEYMLSTIIPVANRT